MLVLTYTDNYYGKEISDPLWGNKSQKFKHSYERKMEVVFSKKSSLKLIISASVTKA